MKRILLSVLAISAFAISAQSQIICRVLEPASILGNKPFTWVDNWGGTPDFNVPGTYVQDTLAIGEDGTPGNSTTTIVHPLSQEGCATFTNAAAVAGKIAVVYRGTCSFVAKALNAQAAGAVAIIIINRDPEAIPMGGADPTVTIPVVMIGSGPGQDITNTMSSSDVVAFLGNKVGLLANDLTLNQPTTLISKSQGVLSQLAQNGTEFNFDIGTRIYNWGSLAQTGVTLNVTVTDPSSATVYDETVSGLTIPANDSLDVNTGGTNTIPNFSLSSYPLGEYTLTYTVSADSTDLAIEDNVMESKFVVNDEVFTYASIDAATLKPNSTSGTRSSTYTQSYSACNFIQHPNASRIGARGVYFSTSNNRVLNPTITGDEILLSVIKWDDALDNLASAGSFAQLSYVSTGSYTYAGDFQDSMVYAEFDVPVLFTDNDKYLVCAQVLSDSTFMGVDAAVDYTFNQNNYLLPIMVSEVDNAFNQVAYGAETIFSLGVKVFDAAEVSVEKIDKLIANAYPNPAEDKLNIRVNAEGNVNLVVTDLSGKIVSNTTVALNNGSTQLNTSNFEAGMYIVNITTENGTSTKVNIVKK
ncbi:MAG: PA domain-containing protein [Bacteroidota bacterium]